MSARRSTVSNGFQQPNVRPAHRKCASTSNVPSWTDTDIATLEDTSFDLDILHEEPPKPVAQAEKDLHHTIKTLFDEVASSHDEFLQRDSVTRPLGSSELADEFQKNLDELHKAWSDLQAAFDQCEQDIKRQTASQSSTEEDEEKFNELYQAFEWHQETLQRVWKLDAKIRQSRVERRKKALEEIQCGFAELKLNELNMKQEDREARHAELAKELRDWMSINGGQGHAQQ